MWWLCLKDVTYEEVEYETGESYINLPEELLNNNPSSFEEEIDEIDINPFNMLNNLEYGPHDIRRR